MVWNISYLYYIQKERSDSAMNIVSSYKAQIVGINKMLKPTLDIYRNALALLIPIIHTEWNDIQNIDLPKAR